MLKLIPFSWSCANAAFSVSLWKFRCSFRKASTNMQGRIGIRWMSLSLTKLASIFFIACCHCGLYSWSNFLWCPSLIAVVRSNRVRGLSKPGICKTSPSHSAFTQAQEWAQKKGHSPSENPERGVPTECEILYFNELMTVKYNLKHKFNETNGYIINCGASTADPPFGGVGMDRVRTKHAVPQRRGPVTTTRHEARQSLVTKRSTWRSDDSARPDSGTTVQYAPGTDTRSLQQAGTDHWRD